VSSGNITTSSDIRKSNVLTFMTRWAKSDEPGQPLNMASIIVIPDLVTLNGVLISLAIADFTAVVGCFERSLLQ
jgi:hypothetical protein